MKTTLSSVNNVAIANELVVQIHLLFGESWAWNSPYLPNVKMSFNLLDSMELNAFAYCVPEDKSKPIQSRVIEVSKGALYQMTYTLVQVLESGLEWVRGEPVLSDLCGRPPSAIRHWAPLIHELALGALRFLLEHEFAHIARGHLEYARRFGVCRLAETEPNTRDALSSEDYKAIEYDADRFALESILRGFSSLTREVETHELSRQTLRSGFASGILFSLFIHSDNDLSSYEGAYHAHPLVRTLYMKEAVDKLSNEAVNARLASKWSAGLDLALRMLSFSFYDRAFRRVSGSWHVPREEGLAECKLQIDQIEKRWGELISFFSDRPR